MIYSSLACAALAASAAIGPFTHSVHFHPKAPDARVAITLRNDSIGFRDVKIDGHSYTVMQHGTLSIKAPAGTVVYADSRTAQFRRGDVMLAMTPAMNGTTVLLP